jgi:hypothetical protein
VVDKVLEVITDGLNAFPLFEVLLRIKEPSRLPRKFKHVDYLRS